MDVLRQNATTGRPPRVPPLLWLRPRRTFGGGIGEPAPQGTSTTRWSRGRRSHPAYPSNWCALFCAAREGRGPVGA